MSIERIIFIAHSSVFFYLFLLCTNKKLNIYVKCDLFFFLFAYITQNAIKWKNSCKTTKQICKIEKYKRKRTTKQIYKIYKLSVVSTQQIFSVVLFFAEKSFGIFPDNNC